MTLEVVVFDVGHGDSILIKSPSNRYAVVDCCKYNGNVPVISEIEKRGITELDFICLTHPHWDHYSGLQTLLDYCINFNIKIHRFFDCGISPPDLRIQFTNFSKLSEFQKLYDRLLSMEEKGQVIMRSCADGLPLQSEKGLEIKALSPHSSVLRRILSAKKRKFANLNQHLNHFSVIIAVTYNSNTLLLLSDAPESDQNITYDRNKMLLRGQVLVVKVSHHGSIEYYCDRIIRKVAVKDENFSVISAGCLYGLPDKKTVQQLNKNRYKTYSTNYWSGSATSSSLLPISGLDPDIAQAVEFLTDPVLEPAPMIPYHGSCSISIMKDGFTQISPSYMQPTL